MIGKELMKQITVQYWFMKARNCKEGQKSLYKRGDFFDILVSSRGDMHHIQEE